MNPARPRSSVRRPAYPTMPIVVMATACAGGATAPPADASSQSTSSEPASVQVVVAATPGPADDSVLVDPKETENDLIADAPTRFPEDDAEPPLIGCGGGCPPAYVLSTQAKDRMQIEARVRYCAKVGRGLWAEPGDISVAAQIDLAGQTKSVQVRSESEVPDPIRRCIERLVGTAPFGHEPAFERTSNAQVAGHEDDPP